jgi:hypothetical protein
MSFTYNAGEIFARLDGSRWQIYRLKDIDAKGYHSLVSDDFVIDGDQIWAAGGHEVIHWDGQRWQIFRDQPAEVIAAGGGEAWALDDKGHLAHFANGQWTPLNTELPKEDWNDDDEGYSRLVRTADGSLWLARQFLWRWDGTGWREIETGFEHVNLVGATADRIWLWEGRNLKAISADGKTQTVYAPDQTTLGNQERVYDAASSGGTTYFSTWWGLLRFDGTEWQRVNLPDGGVKSLTNIAAGTGGDLWAIGQIPNPLWRTPGRSAASSAGSRARHRSRVRSPGAHRAAADTRIVVAGGVGIGGVAGGSVDRISGTPNLLAVGALVELSRVGTGTPLWAHALAIRDEEDAEALGSD